MNLNLRKLSFRFSICQVNDLPFSLLQNQFVFLSNTDDEISFVCPTNLVPNNIISQDDGWVCLKVNSILDFSLVGILADLSSALAKLRISIFVVSTYNTDYIFVKEQAYCKAKLALIEMGHTITE